ncbi:hypothetical protein CAAN1_15S03114 [[Candida] anglica]|uniref:Uncharacterized protein n=1 Tax=[Candida] anglica TaxID=148631 RepID=A0ABP0E886_9ASCO
MPLIVDDLCGVCCHHLPPSSMHTHATHSPSYCLLVLPGMYIRLVVVFRPHYRGLNRLVNEMFLFQDIKVK